MQKKDLPLSLLWDIKKLVNEFQKLIFENEDIIEKVDNEKYLILLRDKEHHAFFFSVSSPNQASDYTSYFNFTYIPQSDVTFNKASFNSDLSNVLSNFKIWIDLLKQYNEINLDERDFITRHYEEELFHEFEIVDEDAHIKPFEHEKQVFLYSLLNCLETELVKELKSDNNSDIEIQAIIAETKSLRESIQSLTKRNVIKNFLEFLQR